MSSWIASTRAANFRPTDVCIFFAALLALYLLPVALSAPAPAPTPSFPPVASLQSGLEKARGAASGIEKQKASSGATKDARGADAAAARCGRSGDRHLDRWLAQPSSALPTGCSIASLAFEGGCLQNVGGECLKLDVGLPVDGQHLVLGLGGWTPPPGRAIPAPPKPKATKGTGVNVVTGPGPDSRAKSKAGPAPGATLVARPATTIREVITIDEGGKVIVRHVSPLRDLGARFG